MNETIKCECCGGEFVPRKKTSKYCSRECVNNARRGVNYNKPRERQCAHCGAMFTAGIHNKVYCSKKCYVDINRKSKSKPKGKKPKIKSIAQMQREAREHGMSYGQYEAYLEMQKGED